MLFSFASLALLALSLRTLSEHAIELRSLIATEAAMIMFLLHEHRDEIARIISYAY